MRWVKKTRVKLCRLSFSTGSAGRNSQSKKIESKKTFFDCVRKPDLGFSRKRPFSTYKSDRIRKGPKATPDGALQLKSISDYDVPYLLD